MRSAAVVVVFALVMCASAQQAPTQPSTSRNDGASIDSIVRALYDVISGPAGQARDWDRFRALFYKDAHLMSAGTRDNGQPADMLAVSDYIDRSSPFFAKNGFFESQIAGKVERFGNVAHVFSSYQSRHAKDGEPFQRGINSIELYYDGARWWITWISWDRETPANPIPDQYLK